MPLWLIEMWIASVSGRQETGLWETGDRTDTEDRRQADPARSHGGLSLSEVQKLALCCNEVFPSLPVGGKGR